MNEENKKHGAFSWCELMTEDVTAARDFYESIFGWEMEVVPMGEFDYTLIKVDSVPVGGIMPLPDECKGAAPTWYNYVTVHDVDATVAKIEKAGGKLLRAATDIPDVGRFCVLQDPQGAIICAITYTESP
ncbi:VOC family protein [Dongshaea marina]|uniref:VOC family protein n=1 Tax=Dongshaea marina TaxID=2047966 RepID=UPI000D3E5B56|nr:VOC family protein [Dongshaea marina]